MEPKVYLCKDSKGGSSIPAAFERCCLSYLGCRDNRMDVGFSYNDGKLEIYPSEQGIRLEHPPGCPCRFLTATDITSIPSSPKTEGVGIGVSIILQSSDNCVLLTRRAKHMRTFPSVWVPPGGHLDPGETLYQGCLRELREETGLSFTEESLQFAPLGLWESVYPPLISMGLPRRHHIVVYLLARAQQDCSTLQRMIQFHKDEVDAVTWLDEFVATEVASSDDYGQSRRVPQKYFEALVHGKNGLEVMKLPLSILMAVLPPSPAAETERLSSGTKFALRQWLKFLYPPLPGGIERADSLETVFLTITKMGHQPVKSPFWAD
ncbi:nucleoside diphosphate-linked moiety X motif 17-like isoform X2 [Actinia tenebrosa]|nr:nucleoside diphosphate-linked moiety X motif 17-like isoform X2 [Actinia tenebrosa]